MRNLPPGVSINDADAPWNQDPRLPDWVCTECDYIGTSEEVKPINPNPECPECGSEIVAY